MNSELITAVVSLVIAFGAALAALWSAIAASSANKRADRANELAVQANEKAAEANEISKQALEEQKLRAPSAWSGLINSGDSAYLLENQSGRDIKILEVTAPTEEEERLIRVTQLPATVSYGDFYQIHAFSTFGGSVSAVIFKWRFVDDPESEIQITRRNVY